MITGRKRAPTAPPVTAPITAPAPGIAPGLPPVVSPIVSPIAGPIGSYPPTCPPMFPAVPFMMPVMAPVYAPYTTMPPAYTPGMVGGGYGDVCPPMAGYGEAPGVAMPYWGGMMPCDPYDGMPYACPRCGYMHRWGAAPGCMHGWYG